MCTSGDERNGESSKQKGQLSTIVRACRQRPFSQFETVSFSFFSFQCALSLSSFAHSCDFFVRNISSVSVHKKGKEKKKKIEGVSKYRFESLYYCECYKVNLSEIDRVCCEDNVAVVFGIL